ncbi:hypothetical protein [Mucilaginibacter terrae]|uniref:CRISPR-associated protein n=1 Tax=Mucilaginibacter terrae TaxID=1955052 RepID=A0ABU3GVH6_9SPHI|nr:hypothetical protein [Mucilaginibacter terrae]MDT3403782.1 hypothetical protein [Mucilaginibacter terrae]
MNAEQFSDNIQSWMDLSGSGRHAEAEKFYYKELFEAVITAFCKKYTGRKTGGLLVSLLGFSPEPVILTASLLQPATHLIVTTPLKQEIVQVLEKYLQPGYQLVILEDTSFKTIYKRIKESLSDFPTSNITVDITGGKKSMVAAAAIFAKDYGSEIVYVDFEVYLKELRKPKPGTEYLNVIYDPLTDQPETSIING